MLSPDEILRLRLANQHLRCPALSDPVAMVAHLGAVQSQDYPAAKWALGQRLTDAADSALDAAFDAGAILRTHVLRPTWHFVTPADIRWLLELTGPRVKIAMGANDRSIGLDEELFRRSDAAFVRALEGGQPLTRPELLSAVQQAGLGIDDGRTLSHLLAHAELDGLVCSGPRRGKEHTYALLDARAPAARRLGYDEALAELCTRYFTSHGPATLRDICWWSGLTISQVRRGLELSGSRLVSETVDDRTYWFAPTPSVPPMPEGVYLLPNYDEYTVAYRERDLFYDPPRAWAFDQREAVPFGNVIVVDGQVAGVWRRTLRPGRVVVEVGWYIEPTAAQRQAVAPAAERYAAFIGLPLELLTRSAA